MSKTNILQIINYIIAAMAIVTMCLCIVKCSRLHSKVPGGVVKKRIRLLIGLLIFFFFGYLASPLFYLLERFEYITSVVYLVFFFGAVFVFLSLGTIESLLHYIGIGKDNR
jgi:hypothetical protein